MQVQVTLGVDTHADFHVAVALDQLGRRLGSLKFATSLEGYSQLLSWAAGLGRVEVASVEGTGSYGAGLSRYLSSRGVIVLEASRPKRQDRRRFGKSDTTDAEAAARSAQAETTLGIPKSSDGFVEMVRVLASTRRSAIKSRVQVANQLHALLLTAPDELVDSLRSLRVPELVETCSRFRTRRSHLTIISITKLSLKQLSIRHRQFSEEISSLDHLLQSLISEHASELLSLKCVGTDIAASLLMCAGDNPERLRTEASFAALCGVSPVEASSGKIVRHRLNRDGDRDANRALHMIALCRMSCDERTRCYVARRTTEGKTKREIIRCLKRYIAREVYRVLTR